MYQNFISISFFTYKKMSITVFLNTNHDRSFWETFYLWSWNVVLS